MDPKYESEGERKSEYIKEDFSSSDWRRESKIAGYEEEEEIKSKCRHDANAHDAGNDSSGSDAEVIMSTLLRVVRHPLFLARGGSPNKHLVLRV